MKLRVTPTAGRQLALVLGYIAERNPRGARHVEARLSQMMDLLLAHPSSGSPTTRPGQRRMLVLPYPYAITYRIGEDEIVILGVRHTSRRPR